MQLDLNCKTVLPKLSRLPVRRKVPSVTYGHPTAATPGSEEKIRVLQRRAELFIELFHPLDGVEFLLKLEEEIYD